MLSKLTVEKLCREAKVFSEVESAFPEPKLFGVTDGKAVGTYLEQKFRSYLQTKYRFDLGNSAKGIDFPSIDVDVKVTSIRQPQSSCPFRSARQKVFGLGYNLLVFVYDKQDDAAKQASVLEIQHVIFVEKRLTADFQMTRGLLEILDSQGNVDDLMGFMADRLLPVEEIELRSIAEEVYRNRPEQGYLTISNALQWRLQYARVITQAGGISGLHRIH
jgi:hypothetical protein